MAIGFLVERGYPAQFPLAGWLADWMAGWFTVDHRLFGWVAASLARLGGL